jgi:hypothetical protein
MKVHVSGMNKLPIATRAQILSMLTEGASMRSVSRLTDTSINTFPFPIGSMVKLKRVAFCVARPFF